MGQIFMALLTVGYIFHCTFYAIELFGKDFCGSRYNYFLHIFLEFANAWKCLEIADKQCLYVLNRD